MDWQLIIFEAIDLRSFSNLWFWIALAFVWSRASYSIIGVPFDMVVRAQRQGGQAADDLADLLRVNIRRFRYIIDVSGLWLVGAASGVLCSLAILGWRYEVEFAQAAFLLGFPMTCVGLLNVRTAYVIAAQNLAGPTLYRKMTRHRFAVQLIGLVAIFITAFWGMSVNLNAQLPGF